MFFRLLIVFSVAVPVVCGGSVAAQEVDRAGVEFFEKKIRPVLAANCYECHSEKAKPLKGGLRLDTAAGIRRGGESGEVLEPGDGEENPLLQALAWDGEFVDMPPKGRLPERLIADFRKWIAMGAPLPAENGTASAPEPREVDIEAGRDFWSFQPVREFAPPRVERADWPRRKLDFFVLRELEARRMQPAEAADRRRLIRRACFDLTGLPPGYEQVQAFVADEREEAYAELIERLLASPHYGERWGRHWLDVARYAEDNPTSESTCKPPKHPWPYRNWVIRALNEDLPFDEFVKRQLAADLMEDLPPAEIAALGFLGLSPVYHKEPKLSKDVIAVIVADEWDERIDTITRGFLGLTVACARCHDHKFDPITVEDYYALAGVMASTQFVEWPLVETSEEEAAALTETYEQIVDYELRLSYAKIMQKTAERKNEPTEEYEERAAELEATLEALKSRELFEGPTVNAVRDAGLWINGEDPDWTWQEFRPGVARDLRVFIRGSVTNRGKIVPRRFLEVLSRNGAAPFRAGSGRRELAEAIVGEAAPLAARVIVNRVWGWHFGRHLVGTPSNFGELGDRPSHPELLDDLAARFIKNGWSLKWLHREIMLSAAYRQSSAYNATFHEADPANEALWRMNRRRLDPELLRDALLAVSGELDRTMGGRSGDLDDPEFRRRAVYGSVSRQKPADILRLFDFPDAKRHTDRRLLTTTPLQQLYLLNSPFVQEQAALTAEEVAAVGGSSREIVRRMFQRILLREPAESELDEALRLAGKQDDKKQWALLAHGLLASNEFLYVD